jgi:DNA-binding protein H-NS
MAEQHQSVSESLDIELDSLSAEDKIDLISEIADALTTQQLRVVREMVDQKRLGKLDEAKAQMIEEMCDKFLQLDLDFDEVMGINRRRRASSLPPKYRSPDGKAWSGRGNAPVWIREDEAAGGNREDCLIKDEA